MASDTKVDPWALLREVRDEIVDLWRDTTCSQHLKADCITCLHQTTAIDRIDAALAVHDAVPPSEVDWIPNGPRGLSGYLKGRVEKASVYQTKDGLWWSSASDIGPFDTLDEAQRAALSAARGTK